MAPEDVEKTGTEEVLDSPTGWVAKHVQRYVASDGKQGHLFNGMPTLLITTRGRRTGKLRRTALIYGEDGGRYVVVASNGGSDTHPAWYLNLVDQPEVEVRVGPEVFTAVARTATAADRPALWKLMAGIFPTYESYRARSSREIPVVILDRV